MTAALALAALASPPSSAAADFLYVPPDGPRPGFAAPDAPDRLSLGRVLRRMAPAGATLRFDRRIDTARRPVRVYGDWTALAFGEGLAWVRRGGEIRFRPAGVAEGAAEFVAPGSGLADWRVRAGETLRGTLGRWTARAGIELLPVTDRRWRLDEDRRWPLLTFGDAVRRLMFALSHLPRPPAAELHGDTLVLSHRRPAAPPAPRGPWRARAGDTLRETLQRWADVAGHEVRFETARRWRLKADREHPDLGALEASAALVAALARLPHPPEAAVEDGVLVVRDRPRENPP